MNTDLQTLINQGENQSLEFKSALAKEMSELMRMFQQSGMFHEVYG